MIRRELPVSVDIGSETYKIDADFRTIMNVEGIIFGKKVTDDQKKFAAEMMKEIDIEEKDAIQNAKYYDALKPFTKIMFRMIWKKLWKKCCGFIPVVRKINNQKQKQRKK